MPSLINDLLIPSSLPDKTENIDLVQTHISMVFVADEFVYKVKKAVNFGFLDFSTLEKRKYYCHQEVKLNQRLSKGIYIGVLPITYDGRSHKMEEGRGEVVEYAVKMRRIPDDVLMKYIFNRGALGIEHLNGIARILANFHSNAKQLLEIDEFGKPEVFRVNTDENFKQTEKYIGATIERKDFDVLRKWTDNFYKANKGIFEDRVAAGKIRDCHGDLHMEHVCLQDPISIIDCIEFNDRFRYTDTIADIAFLLMDLEYAGAKDFSNNLWKFYVELTGDKDMDPLLSFYKVYRAYVRGKVNSFQLDDEQIDPSARKKAAQSARKYFELAKSYIA
ncbi:MAG: gluconokinase [Thermodesulfobacteriota bacterium]|nr:gluconokinase [Thermodesulfobacteriota bacterium]